jgi:hypothetical protein
MDYIRAQSDHDLNTRHAVFSGDTDLILLGLIIRTKYLKIMRECKQKKEGRKPYEFIDVSVLREDLKNYLECDDLLPLQWNRNRAIDDWVFMCFLAGNDFFSKLTIDSILWRYYGSSYRYVQNTSSETFSLFNRKWLTEYGSSEDSFRTFWRKARRYIYETKSRSKSLEY